MVEVTQETWERIWKSIKRAFLKDAPPDFDQIARCCIEVHLEAKEAEFTQWRSEIEIAHLDELATERAKVEKLRATVQTLVQLAIDGGLTHDLMAQLCPDSKKPNGQPADDFAKRAQRAVNEARATLAETQP